MAGESYTDIYENLSISAGDKKWVSAAAVADAGNSQAIVVMPTLTQRRTARFLAVGAATLQNRSGSTVALGLGGRIPAALWTAGQVTAAGVYTDDTVNAQDVAAGDFPLHAGAESGSGALISCPIRFNLLGLIQSTAGDQVSPVAIVEFWNGADWIDITTSLLINDVLIADGIGEKVLCWPIPPGEEWVVGGSGVGVPADMFNIRVRHENGGAGTADPAASQLFVGFAKMAIGNIPNNQVASLLRSHEFRFPREIDALFSLFSAADRANLVEVDVKVYN
jgi:hypothetical protein